MDLKDLKQATTYAINEARKNSDLIQKGLVGWEDVECTEARIVINDDGEVRYEVLIDQVDPNNRQFQQFIGCELIKAGFDVEVFTEW